MSDDELIANAIRDAIQDGTFVPTVRPSNHQIADAIRDAIADGSLKPPNATSPSSRN